MEGPSNEIINGEKMYKMINQVRQETRLSYKLASQAVYVVLENLAVLTPSPLTSIINEIIKDLEMPLEATNALLDSTEDMGRLLNILENLDAVKNDAQQRSWELYDDQASIIECLNELNSILADADISIVQRFLQITDYGIVSCLAEYYQMESRRAIKIIILEITDLLCILSRTAIEILIGSVFPLELTRDIQINHEDNKKLFICIRILTKLFAIGEPIPVIYFDTINQDFILFLLNLIETPSDDPDQEENVSLLVFLILAYNLQFRDGEPKSQNITIRAIEEAENPKIFSETLLLLFNRGKDPVKILNHLPYPPNSLLKMITDIFCSATASNIFYRNDVKVLIDIVLRQLTDDLPDSQENMQWLDLIKQILAKTDKSIYLDRLDEIEFCISRISGGISEEINNDAKLLIRELFDYISDCR